MGFIAVLCRRYRSDCNGKLGCKVGACKAESVKKFYNPKSFTKSTEISKNTIEHITNIETPTLSPGPQLPVLRKSDRITKQTKFYGRD
jgi:hypothetical protein